MNREETAVLLEEIRQVDNRTYTLDTIERWYECLQMVPLDDAREAVRHHWRHRTEWLMIGHITGYTDDLRERRRAQFVYEPDPAYDDDPLAAKRHQAMMRAAVGAGLLPLPPLLRDALPRGGAPAPSVVRAALAPCRPTGRPLAPGGSPRALEASPGASLPASGATRQERL